MNRFQDWPKKLDTFIEENRNRPFKRGQNDCALLAGLAIQAMTGQSFVKTYMTGYKTKKEAFEMLQNMGLEDLEAVATKHLGQPLKSHRMAGRGDIVLIDFFEEFADLGESVALGVVDTTGRFAVTTGKDGLITIPMKHWSKAWRV